MKAKQTHQLHILMSEKQIKKLKLLSIKTKLSVGSMIRELVEIFAENHFLGK